MTGIEEYRLKVFNYIPSLKFLDGFDQNDKEADESDIDEEDFGNEEDEGMFSHTSFSLAPSAPKSKSMIVLGT